MDKKRIMRLRVDAQKIRPSLHVGKEGLNSKVIDELDKQLEKRKIIKVRVLSSFDEDRKEVAATIAKETRAFVVDVRGSTIVLARD